MKFTARPCTRLYVMLTVVAIAAGVGDDGRVSAAPRLHSGQAAQQPAAATPLVVIKSQYRRLSFDVDIRRLAVGDTEILSAELINSREVLTLGRQTGRTTVIAWLADGTSREFVFAVQRDLSVLERALKSLHPSIMVDSAPDRDALVLTGVVPDLNVSAAAESVARNYLGSLAGGGAAQPLIAVPPAPGADAAKEQARTLGPGAVPAPTSAVINLLRLETLPASREERVRDAVRAVGGERVAVRRVVRGAMPDDSQDTLVLEGDVTNQTALTRVLMLAAQLYTGQTISASDIKVVSDESGGLADQNQSQSQAQQTQLGGGSSSSLFGGARGSRLNNQVRTNLARATAIELAGGRILSFIKVKDLPQVRVQIRLYEINRTKLREFGIDSAMINSDFRQPSLNPAGSATAVQGDQAARVGAAGAAIQNVLSFLSGGLANELQFAGGGLAVDSVLKMLERAGIAQTLSSPSLTVLSGEMAQVQVGGEVPVPVAFAPAFGNTSAAAATTGGASGAGGAGGGGAATTPGVFSSVDFIPFGVQLQVRPLVGDDDSITLDVQPMVVTPDSVLTDAIRQSSGSAVATTAFQTRALRTSSRLQDGEALLIAGLVSQNSATNSASTPVLRRVPILGRLFESFNRNDQDTELFVVVNPALVRTRPPTVAQWSFVDRQETLRSVVQGLAARPTAKPD